MNSGRMVLALAGLLAVFAGSAGAQDWPQWRGPDRDGNVEGFQAPKTWPEELKQQWKVTVGEGVATPALVGDKLYVFGRQNNQEVVRCLNAKTGEELWKDEYAAEDAGGAAARFAVLGPRSSPAVSDGKVVTLGTRGTLSCLEAESGKLLWRKDDYRAWPRFYVSSSPLIVDGLCIAQLGGESRGAIVAYDLASGDEKWKWMGNTGADVPAYGSPVIANVGELKAIIAPTEGKLIAVNAKDGGLLLEQPYEQGRYNASTPIVDGQTLILAGPTRGVTAKKLVRDGDKLKTEEMWSNSDNSLMYNTPVLKDGLLFGISNLNSQFCINTKTGETAWNAPTDASANRGEARQQQEPGQQRGRRGRRGGSGGGGYGSVVVAGNVIFALPPSGELIVFEASDQDYKELARYKVAGGDTYTYPIVAGSRIYTKDKDAVTLWTLE